MRFKPPKNFDDRGFQVEFRIMDCPPTTKEKTSLVFFTTLLTRIILDKKMKVNFYLPMSLVDQNFKKLISVNSHLK